MNAAPASRRYRVALHRTSRGYVATVAELPGCIARGASEVEAVEGARGAIRAFLALAAAIEGEPLALLEIAP